jgi:hypothetical protein
LRHVSSTTAGSDASMAMGKTSTRAFRIEPALKEALRADAEREHCSAANMAEVLLRDYCGRSGITKPE